MIIQSAPPGQSHFVMTMAQHTMLAGRFAAEFGNKEFEAVAPRELMLFVVSNHDAGWRAFDASVIRDPSTGLPYHLVKTPMDTIVRTSTASPEFNSQKHPFCELLSSMHSWGLYNGRYGMSEKVLLDAIAEPYLEVVESMLTHEKSRQERLIDLLEKDPTTAVWVEREKLFQSYKQLQFFDTLALYFNCTHPSEREATNFQHVPINESEDVDIHLEPSAENTYRLFPYPFADDGIVFEFVGRNLSASPDQKSLYRQFETAVEVKQKIKLCA